MQVLSYLALQFAHYFFESLTHFLKFHFVILNLLIHLLHYFLKKNKNIVVKIKTKKIAKFKIRISFKFLKKFDENSYFLLPFLSVILM